MSVQARDAAIVGIHEYPLRDVEGTVSPLQIKAECAARALEDAGLHWSDVDAVYDAGDGGGMAGFTVAEYFGLKPRVIDTTGVGGSSYEYHAAHARRDIAAGKARVALLTYGSTAHSNARAIGVGGRGGGGHPADNMDPFAGMTLVVEPPRNEWSARPQASRCAASARGRIRHTSRADNKADGRLWARPSGGRRNAPRGVAAA